MVKKMKMIGYPAAVLKLPTRMSRIRILHRIQTLYLGSLLFNCSTPNMDMDTKDNKRGHRNHYRAWRRLVRLILLQSRKVTALQGKNHLYKPPSLPPMQILPLFQTEALNLCNISAQRCNVTDRPICPQKATIPCQNLAQETIPSVCPSRGHHRPTPSLVDRIICDRTH